MHHVNAMCQWYTANWGNCFCKGLLCSYLELTRMVKGGMTRVLVRQGPWIPEDRRATHSGCTWDKAIRMAKQSNPWCDVRSCFNQQDYAKSLITYLDLWWFELIYDAWNQSVNLMIFKFSLGLLLPHVWCKRFNCFGWINLHAKLLHTLGNCQRV